MSRFPGDSDAWSSLRPTALSDPGDRGCREALGANAGNSEGSPACPGGGVPGEWGFRGQGSDPQGGCKRPFHLAMCNFLRNLTLNSPCTRLVPAMESLGGCEAPSSCSLPALSRTQQPWGCDAKPISFRELIPKRRPDAGASVENEEKVERFRRATVRSLKRELGSPGSRLTSALSRAPACGCELPAWPSQCPGALDCRSLFWAEVQSQLVAWIPV